MKNELVIYQNAVKALSALSDKGRLSAEEGRLLIGEADWTEFIHWAKDNGKGAVTVLLGGDILLKSKAECAALIKRCEMRYSDLLSEETERVNRIIEMRENIKAAKSARITSWISVAISVLALAVSVWAVVSG